MIQYVNKLPSKIEYYDMMKSVYDDIDVTEMSIELDSTIAAVCAYKGERLIGIGRVKQEGNYVCIEDLIVKLDAYKEEVQNSIIISLIDQINKLKLYNVTVRDCLEKTITGEGQKVNYVPTNNYTEQKQEEGPFVYA